MFHSIYFGKTVISLKTVDSTNNYSTEVLKQGIVPEGTVIMAEEQTAGRGQRGNSWISQPGMNLTCSFILSPSFLELSQHFMLTRTISLGVADALTHLLKERVSIKWPNDILYNDKKLAGILIETISSSNKITHAVAGIGINVNQLGDLSKFSATSLKDITGNDYNLREILDVLSFFLEKKYLKLKSGNDKTFRDEYHEYLYGMNEWKKYTTGNDSFDGLIKDVTPEGYLVVEKKDGSSDRYDLKQISLLR